MKSRRRGVMAQMARQKTWNWMGLVSILNQGKINQNLLALVFGWWLWNLYEPTNWCKYTWHTWHHVWMVIIWNHVVQQQLKKQDCEELAWFESLKLVLTVLPKYTHVDCVVQENIQNWSIMDLYVINVNDAPLWVPTLKKLSQHSRSGDLLFLRTISNSAFIWPFETSLANALYLLKIRLFL